MPSKQVVDRQKEAQAVLSAGTTHTDEIVKRLETLFAPFLRRGEKQPDFELVLELMGRLLQQSLTQMVTADDDYQKELLDDAEPRQRRDEAAAVLRQKLIDLRDTLGGLYGAATLQACGFVGATPEDPTLLSRFAGGVNKALAKARLPKPRLPGLTMNSKAVCAELDALVKALEQALGDVSRESREGQAALALRNTAQSSFDESYSGVANLLIGLLRLTGQHELADRVRLTWRSSAVEPTPAPAGPAGSSAGQPSSPPMQ